MPGVREMTGSKPGHLGRAPKQGATGRVCETEGCETRLSVYNSRETCFRHSPTRYPRTRGRMVPDVPDPQDRVEP